MYVKTAPLSYREKEWNRVCTCGAPVLYSCVCSLPILSFAFSFYPPDNTNKQRLTMQQTMEKILPFYHLTLLSLNRIGSMVGASISSARLVVPFESASCLSRRLGRPSLSTMLLGSPSSSTHCTPSISIGISRSCSSSTSTSPSMCPSFSPSLPSSNAFALSMPEKSFRVKRIS